MEITQQLDSITEGFRDIKDQTKRIKEQVDVYGPTVSAFHEYRDRANEEMKKFGDALGDTKETLEKINTKLSDIELGKEEAKKIGAQYEELSGKLEEQTKSIDEIKTSLNAPKLPSYEQKKIEQRFDELKSHYRKRFYHDDRRSVKVASPEELNEYRRIEQKWMRYGELTPDEMKVLSTDVSTAAGVLCSPDREQDIIKEVIEYSPVRDLARIKNTNKGTVEFPKRTAQFSATYAGESSTRSETTGLTYAVEEIKTHLVHALVLVTVEQLGDADYDMEEEINMEAAERYGVFEGTEFVTGTSGRIEGVMASSTGIGYTPSGAASTISSGDCLITLTHAMKEYYFDRSTWMMKRATLGTVRALKDGEGNYLWTAGFGTNPPTLCGRPYREGTDMPSITTNTYPIVLGAWREGYVVVDRTGIQLQRLTELYSGSGQIGFQFSRRIGGGVVLPAAFRWLKVATS